MLRKVSAALTAAALCFASPVRADNAEAKAVKLVERYGGKITRDDKRPGKPILAVDLSKTYFRGSELKILAAFPQLAALDLRGLTNVHERDLSILGHFPSLTTVGLTVNERWFEELAKLRNITTLDLDVYEATDAGMKLLAPLKSVRKLDLRFTKVTDEGLKALAGFKNLTTLVLPYSTVTERGLKELASLTQLTSLELPIVRVTEHGLKELAPLTKLTTLRVGPISDAGVKELATFKQLTSLRIHGLTEAGVKELAALQQLTSLNNHRN